MVVGKFWVLVLFCNFIDMYVYKYYICIFNSWRVNVFFKGWFYLINSVRINDISMYEDKFGDIIYFL